MFLMQTFQNIKLMSFLNIRTHGENMFTPKIIKGGKKCMPELNKTKLRHKLKTRFEQIFLRRIILVQDLILLKGKKFGLHFRI